MATCRETAERALRALGRLGAGRTARVVDAETALETLKDTYKALINQGTFGRLRDVVPTSNYVAGENERVFRNTDDVESIELPELVGETLGGPLTPLDLSVVVIVDGIEGQTSTWLYDGGVKAWQSVDDLTLESQAPLSERDNRGLSALVASRMADDYGLDTPSSTQMNARAFMSSLTHRYSNPVMVRPGTFY